MDSHPETVLDAQMSNLEEEEDRMEGQYDSGEEEDVENEDPSGITPTMPHLESPIDYFHIRQQQQQLEEQKQRMEFLAQKELLIKREDGVQQAAAYSSSHSSKSTTPSPSSPPQMQYLYAAGHPFTAASFLQQSQQMAAAAAAAAQAAAVAQAAAAAAQQQPSEQQLQGGKSTPPTSNGADQTKYTYEEQFKQLYEINDDPGRKEFLDDLFTFWQKRGMPVNRIPIMAKQVLDLYQLYRLVISRGGLVEVINKKIWREITKGLNLPSTITSAAFTLRTQYMKYLYDYECEREKLSSRDELQAAIDGNRREGRRSSYGPYGELITQGAVPVSRTGQHQPISSPLSLVSRHVNGHGGTGGLTSRVGGRAASASPLPLAYYHNSSSTPAQLPLNLAHQENGLYGSHNFSSGEEDKSNSVPSTPNPMVMPQQEALNLEVSRNSTENDQKPLNMKRKVQDEVDVKKSRTEDDKSLARAGMPSTHIKIANNRGPDGRTSSDGSLMVSMEVNGIMYEGVLYAAPNYRNRL